MATSTRNCIICLAILLGIASQAAWATETTEQPVLGIAPLAHSLPHVRTGIAALLGQELGLTGRFALADNRVVARLLAGDEALGQSELKPADYPFLGAGELERFVGVCDYLLVGEILALEIANREDSMEFSESFSEANRILGASNQSAHARFSLRLLRVTDGAELTSLLVEGLESRKGEKLDYVSLGWLGSIDFSSEEFRSTNLGRATYKALGEAIRVLAAHFPLTGRVLALSEDAAVINLGAAAGLALGDELLVFRVKEIEDTTGQVVWTNEARIGSLEVVEFQGANCLAVVLDGLGEIMEGDVVRPSVARLSVPIETDEVH